MTNKKDLYDILGVSRSASEAEIKKAYRTLAKKYHPDMNKETGAEAQFKEIQSAYDVLSDPSKKAKYDQFGHAAFDQQGGGGYSGGFEDLNDLFGSFFGGGFGGQGARQRGPAKGQDRFMQIKIDFMDAVFGKKETLTLDVDEVCDQCLGSGAHSKADVGVCATCNGRGQTVTQQRTPFGVFQSTATCPTCQGSGKSIKKKCSTCSGKGYTRKRMSVDVNIPAGINTGQQLRVTGKGERGAQGGPNGDLYLEIVVAKHKHFVREGKNIYIQVPISNIDATLGTIIDVPTVYGDIELTIPSGTQSGTQFRIKGKGLKDLRTDSNGDQYVEVKVDIPTKLSREEKEAYEKLRKLSSNQSIYKKFKDSFK
ncbi:MAG: molecular chaperone DnaJ [Erysipelothrix sp.]|jgi:molecular chaperone DnaJ|nr:molecular chaperone DnaJ [Erysipelothrix sp.]